jgi:hypothetical protein
MRVQQLGFFIDYHQPSICVFPMQISRMQR